MDQSAGVIAPSRGQQNVVEWKVVSSNTSCSEQLQCIRWNHLLICDVQIFYFNTVRNCKIKSSNLTPLSVFVFLITVVIHVNTDKDLSCELHIYFKSNNCCWICILFNAYNIFFYALYSVLFSVTIGKLWKYTPQLNSDVILIIFLLWSLKDLVLFVVKDCSMFRAGSRYC